ncbi:MAG: quinolinate synthase NadA [Deltaproteobacteria bacterium]|nr:quinolinate synthase NadA [Deltaproteobacteria bacterium]MBW2284750.1 quinolinate synthase NadA [Deltaproteobacteria bacterium]
MTTETNPIREHIRDLLKKRNGILYPLSKAHPDKRFIPADPGMVCPDMKKTGLEDILNALENLSPEIRVPDDIRGKAKGAVDRMLAIPRS